MNIAISGMNDDASIRRVKKALAGVQGIQIDRVEVGRAVVHVDADGLKNVLDAIRKAGFEPWAQQ